MKLLELRKADEGTRNSVPKDLGVKQHISIFYSEKSMDVYSPIMRVQAFSQDTYIENPASHERGERMRKEMEKDMDTHGFRRKDLDTHYFRVWIVPQ